MPTTYRATLTNVGAALVADAIASGTTLTWAKMALGDGNGSAVIVDAGRTSLVNERYRAPLNDLGRDSANPNTIVGTLVVPPETGGWTIREFGIYDNASTPRLVAYGETPEIEKPASAAGTGINLRLRFKLVVSADANITLSPDSNEAYATIEYVKDNAVKSLSVSGRTITYTMGDGDTHTIQTQDTTYNDATQAVHGLMSVNDKKKLDGIEAQAEVNQNAFSNVKVGNVTVAADSKTDTLELVAGDNITLTVNATNDKITIVATDTIYTHPNSPGNKHIPSGGDDNQLLFWSGNGTAQWDNPKWVPTTGTPTIALEGIDNRSPDDTFGIWDGNGGGTGRIFLYASSNHTNGATLDLIGANYAGNNWVPGSFNIVTGGQNNCALRGLPNGNLLWENNKVITIVDIATASQPGVMSVSDKKKLDGITIFVGSGTNAAVGLVPKPPTTQGITKYLCEDATWRIPQYIPITGTPLCQLNGLDNRPDNGSFAIWNGSTNTSGHLMLLASNSASNGANIELYGNTATSHAGNFRLSSGTSGYTLEGTKDGNLTWRGNNIANDLINGTLTATSLVTGNYSSVYRCGRVGYLMIGCGVSAAAKTAWTDTTLYTSDIKPAKAVYQVVNNQDNTSAGCVEITTTGNVILHTYGKALTDGFIRCSVVFAV